MKLYAEYVGTLGTLSIVIQWEFTNKLCISLLFVYNILLLRLFLVTT